MANTKAYIEGWKAERKGLTPTDNPYVYGSEQAADWSAGYSCALFDDV